MTNALDILTERGFIEQTTHDDELRRYLASDGRSCYIGFDPTASSLHVGSLVPIMSLAHMQRQGHRPIALVGGGTGLIGDPSGKTEMRRLLTPELVAENAAALKNQLSNFIDFSQGKALLVNNADWLAGLGYIELLRDIGRHFSVNRMIKAESYRARLESEEGLSFIEFNYMILQAYDFLHLFQAHDCGLQMGGSDQWGNIVAGIELIRRSIGKPAFGITFPLITTAAGIKMGKTHAGAVWLDAERTSPYEYYQFWVNTDDRDVARFLALFTFLPMDEIRAAETLSGADLNVAKAVLAFEATAIAHGREAAVSAREAAASMFGARAVPDSLLPSSGVPRGGDEAGEEAVPASVVSADEMGDGMPAFKVFVLSGLAASGGAARRLIQQGGAYINGHRVEAPEAIVSPADFKEGELLLRAGKKRFHRLRLPAA
ncbi:MAG: tyrosine--tRNA ligase [Desulfococcaceae bacterium]